MDIVHIEPFTVTGFVVRTTNTQEMNPSTAKIGALWEKFYATASAKLTDSSRVYGLYTNYESDATGAFDVIACSDTLTSNELQDTSSYQIASGDYLKFSAKGEMPQAVIKLWAEIWNYFESNSHPHVRAFTTDFEHHKNADEVEIYISVKDRR